MVVLDGDAGPVLRATEKTATNGETVRAEAKSPESRESPENTRMGASVDAQNCDRPEHRHRHQPLGMPSWHLRM